MATLVELDKERHAGLKVRDGAAVRFVSSHHVMNLRVNELPQAAASLPVMATRNPDTGQWTMTALTSFEQGVNLCVEDGEWTSTWLPVSMQAHPVYLMQSSESERGYTFGIPEGTDDFGDEGEALYDDSGRPSIYLSRITALLESDVEHSIQTHAFLERASELGLFKGLDIVVSFADESQQTLAGLYTFDEDKLKTLPDETIAELNRTGFLILAHAALLSLNQVNALIRRNNRNPSLRPIARVTLEVAKDHTLGV